MKYCKPELSFFIFTSYERSECFIFGVKRKMLHNEVASSEKAGPDWVKHACRRMKHFAALPQNMKHRRCGMKQSLFRLHVFLPWNQGKKMAERAGFEPAVRLPPQRFSRPSPSTAQPSLQRVFTPKYSTAEKKRQSFFEKKRNFFWKMMKNLLF